MSVQGIWLDNARPKSKKAVREAIAANPSTVYVEAVSFFGNDWSGPVSDLAVGQGITFVGPDPARARNFFGRIIRTPSGFKVE